ncbi:MAG: CooT family nickel-binding protein [Deltaproteobacteria bacterium]|nr:CooT family nickel-binding protein [Deltaproteobacteria bacterium]MBW2047072.1 CooT family nickel-binding protein [Deltaproteobacteria bacterium]MBW2110499.1 CooT family nickel-binding protein [Deltaproteobacteria bacterium]MBW2351613.1 CooT family nickel-binding protein [Deltaproteobacteria bacterium]HDZ89389.1 CooT family nickel-binding protein [Deltaproteobacteria bacterium]
MCEAHAYMLKDSEEEKILESVDLVEFEGDEIRLVNIFGEQKTLRGRLVRYESNGGKLIFQVP